MRGLLAGITLAMAIPRRISSRVSDIPCFRRLISRSHVLTRRIPAIEATGAATVLCVDKTGTLTLNKEMAVSMLYAKYLLDIPLHNSLPENFHELVEFSILASQRDPFDPMEKAIIYLGNRYLAKTEHLHSDWKLVHQYPLSKELMALSHVWQSRDDANYVIAAKGAPEAIVVMPFQ